GRHHQRDRPPARHRIAHGRLPGGQLMPLDELVGFLDSSPSPWHVVKTGRARLVEAGFTPVDPGQQWDGVPARGLVTRGGALVAWLRGESAGTRSPLRIVGAHTD